MKTKMRDPERCGLMSRREKETLILLFTGKTNAEIAASLGVCRGTVELYKGRLRTRLGLQGGRRALIPMLIAVLSEGKFPADKEINPRARRIFLDALAERSGDAAVRKQVGSLVAGLLAP